MDTSISEIDESQPAIDWQQPEGLLGDIAKSICDNSVLPNRAVALAGAIAFAAGVGGRSYNISNTGLIQWLILLGPTASGKDAASSGMNAFFTAARKEVPGVAAFQGPAYIASAPALLKYMADDGKGSPCIVARQGEIAGFLRRLNDPRSNASDKQLNAFLLDVFMQSGEGRPLQGSIYRDSQKNTGPVESPALTIYGDSTHQEFYSVIDESNITSGLVSRFTVIECEDTKPTFNQLHGTFPIADKLLSDLITFSVQCVKCVNDNVVIKVQEDESAKRFALDYQAECLDKTWNDRNSPLAAIWHRAHLRLLRLGGLVAVGKNPIQPLVTINDYKWAKVLIDAGANAVVRQFNSGNVGQRNDHNEQYQLMEQTIKSYLAKPWTQQFEKSYYVDEYQKDSLRVIHYQYFNANLRKAKPFRNASNFILTFNSLIKQFCDKGVLEEIPQSCTNRELRRNRSGRMFQIRR